MKFLVALALSLVGSVSAFCPNLCNGHGKCENNDRCECYKYSGTTRGDAGGYYEYTQQRAAWTGADCSLRTCPLAFSFVGHAPNGLSFVKPSNANFAAGFTFAVTVDDVGSLVGPLTSYCAFGGSLGKGQKVRLVLDADSTATQILTISSCSHATTVLTVFTQESITLTGAGKAYFESLEVDADTTTYITASTDWGQWDANNAHGLAECAGQGICDRSTGSCQCFPGYEGESCTRTTCPNSCSGHGICISAKRMAADFSQLYSQAWDSNKHFGCKCDAGYRGPDCSLQECPSDFDPLNGCGGGRCNNGGFYQARSGAWVSCPNRILTTSAISIQGNLNNYEIDTSDCLTGEQRDCSGRGICDYETGSCKCFSGFFGESCNIQTVLV